MSGVGSRTICGTPWSFLILPSAARTGRKSATAAAMTTTSAAGARSSIAACICAAVSTGRTLTPAGAGQVDGADDRHLGTLRGRLGGDRVALLAAAAVGDHAHGVDRLTCAAGADDDTDPGQRPGAEHPLDGGDDRRRVGQAAGPDVTAGQAPGLGLDDVDAARAQRGDVRLDRRVLPHLGVHRRADDDRRTGGQQHVGEQVGGQARRVGGRAAAPSPGRRRSGRRSARGGCAGSGWPRPTARSAPARWPAPRTSCGRRSARHPRSSPGRRARRRRRGDGTPRSPCRRRCRR